MTSQLPLITLLFHLMGAVALISMCIGSIRRMAVSSGLKAVLEGLVFGVAAVIAVFSPIELEPGITADGRTLLLAFAAAFGGPLTYLIAAVVAVAAKLLSTGSLPPIGLAATASAGIVGLLWHFFILPRRQFSTKSLLILGLMISSLSLLFFLMPGEIALKLFLRSTPFTLLTALAGSLLVGKFIGRELRHISTEQSWRDEALTDSLTGLANRREFALALRKVDATNIRTTMLVLDVDHFKRLNDNHGHGMGDKVLSELGPILKNCAGELGDAYRIGGEEFVMVLKTGMPAALKVAEAIRSTVASRKFTLDGTSATATISIGLASVQWGIPAKHSVEQADTALYLAKAGGRNRVVSHDDVKLRGAAPASAPLPVTPESTARPGKIA